VARCTEQGLATIVAGYGALTMKNALAATMTTLPEQLRRSCTDLTPVEYEELHYRQQPALAEKLVPTS